MPITEFEFMVRRPDVYDVDLDAFLFVVERTENGDLLFEEEGKTSGATVYHRTREKYARTKRRR